MQIKATSPDEYTNQLVEERRIAINKLRKAIKDNLSDNIEETMSYGMIGYVIPLSSYPDGYHCDPSLPLPFINIASQKNFIAVYHMGMYAKKELADWFVTEYKKQSKTKLDMGKSCIRFKKIDQIPYNLIGKLTKKMTAKEWISIYESTIK